MGCLLEREDEEWATTKGAKYTKREYLRFRPKRKLRNTGQNLFFRVIRAFRG